MLQLVNQAADLANQVTTALKWEAQFSPKPGLVTATSNGAHSDMNCALFLRSATALTPSFAAMAAAGQNTPVGSQLRANIGAIGRQGETAMFAATEGINTHKGAIWALGLLVTAVSVTQSNDWRTILSTAQSLAQLPDLGLQQSAALTHGQVVKQQFALTGAKGEAQNGFPNIKLAFQPVLADTTQDSWLRCLLTLCANVADTNIVHRSNLATLQAFQQLAQTILTNPEPVLQNPKFDQLQAFALAHQISPGGSADLFAACYFLIHLRLIK